MTPVLRRLLPAFFAEHRLASSVADRSPAAPFGSILLPAFAPSPMSPPPEPAAPTLVAHGFSPGALPSAVRDELKSVETEIKYAGYLGQQQKAIERLKKAEQRSIPDWFDYSRVSGLSREMKEEAAAGAPAHHRPSQPYSRGHSRRRLPGQRFYRDPGATVPAVQPSRRLEIESG